MFLPDRPFRTNFARTSCAPSVLAQNSVYTLSRINRTFAFCIPVPPSLRAESTDTKSLYPLPEQFQVERPRRQLGVLGQRRAIAVGPAGSRFGGRAAAVRVHRPVPAVLHGIDDGHGLRRARLPGHPVRLHGRGRFRDLRAVRPGDGRGRVARRQPRRQTGRAGRPRHVEVRSAARNGRAEGAAAQGPTPCTGLILIRGLVIPERMGLLQKNRSFSIHSKVSYLQI